MIVAERKPFDEVLALAAPYRKVLVLGCGSCVTVCVTGGERQAEMLASQLRLARRKAGQEIQVDFDCITRQCDAEFSDNLKHDPHEYDAVLSIACGVGVGFMAGLYPDIPFLPGLNTTFYGANTAEGTWSEYCHGCGDCVLAWTGGICPIARCSKSLINGTCGGTGYDGSCEVSRDHPCGWKLIYDRLKELGRVEELRKIRPPRNWKKDRSGGLRRLSHEELAKIDQEQGQ
jgi:ferredoxin